MIRRLLLLVLALLIATPAAIAQETPVTIRAGRLIDGAGGVREGVTITVQGSRITDVSAAGAGVRATYDLSALTVLPGLIDTHVHLTAHFDADGRTHDDPDESPARTILHAAENAYATLMAGFTTVQSLGSPLDRDLRDAIARGTLPGPRVLTSVRPVTAGTGSPAEIRAFVRELAADGADVVKVFASASIREGGGLVMTGEQLRAVCGEAAGLTAVVEKLSPPALGSSQPAASVAAPATSSTAYFATFAVASVSVIVDAVPTVGFTPSGKAMPGPVPS